MIETTFLQMKKHLDFKGQITFFFKSCYAAFCIYLELVRIFLIYSEYLENEFTKKTTPCYPYSYCIGEQNNNCSQ